MKRIPSMFVLTALLLSLGAAVYAQTDTSATKETPAQERAEEKQEAKKAPKTHRARTRAAKMKAMDLNTATKEELTKVPGITDDIADKIIAGRPYTSKSELTSKNILTKVEYRKVSRHLTVKKASATTSAK